MEKTIETQRVSWKNGGRTADQWRATLRAYALPKLGDVPINSITAADVVSVLLPVWSDKPDTARRLRRRISTIMQAAVAEGHRLDDPAGPALTAALPKPGRKPANHYTALPHAEVGAAIAKVPDARRGMDRDAALFRVHRTDGVPQRRSESREVGRNRP